MTIYFDKLIDRYIPTDSGWNFHPDNTATLTAIEEEGVIDKLSIDQANPLPHEYKQLMFSNVASAGNATVYYLDMVTSKDSGALPEIVKDLAASNAKAIKLAPETTMIFRTNYPYNKDRLKKVLCRCRKDAGAPTLHVGVICIKDGAYVQLDNTYGTDTFIELATSTSSVVGTEYSTHIGYTLGTDSAANVLADARPNNDPDNPAPLLDGTTDIALMIRTGAGSGDVYIDSIELQDTENGLTDLPQGRFVVDSLEGLTDDNKLSPVEKTYIKTLITEIDAEYTGVLADGTAAGVSSTLLTALTTKYNALHAVVDPLLLDMTMASDITSAFDDAFSEYYSAKTAVQSEAANLNNIKLDLSSNTSLITVSPRGELRTEKIIFSVNTHGIADLSDIEWKLSYEENTGDGLDYIYLSESVIDYSKRLLNCNTVFVDDFTLSVTYTVGTRTYSASLTISKAVDGSALPAYQNALDTVPVITSEGALIQDDFFLYLGPYLGNGTAPTEEDLEEYRKDGELTEVPESVNNEFIYGRLYKYVGQESAACTIGQTASNSIIISNAAALVYVVGLTVYLNGETERRTITGITTHDVSNKKIALSGAAFDTTTDSLVYIDVWSESRDSTHLSDASADALAIARNSGVWMYCAVLVAQLGLFGELLIEDKIESTNYEEYDADVIDAEPTSPTYGQVIHTKGEPKTGFKLDGKNNEIKAYAMKAYDSTFYGTVESSGFKTLTGSNPIVISAHNITPSIYRYSDMLQWIPDQDTFASVSGTLEGFAFTQILRRNNSRIRIAGPVSHSENISAGEITTMCSIYPDFVFGRSVLIQAAGKYSGNFSERILGYNDAYLWKNSSQPLQINYDGTLLPGGRLGTSFTYSSIVNFPTQFSVAKIIFGNGAWWGDVTGSVYYLQAYTGSTFNGIVVKNGSQYGVYSTQPNAYYSNSKTFSVGGHTQYDIDNYVSGELFWQLFNALPDIADGYLSAGEIKVRRIGGADEVATVTRLKKDLSGISFYTSSGIIRVDRFSEGGSTGVYEHLEITEDIYFKIVPDGIEVKSVLPWGTFSEIDTNVSIGTSDSRFDSGYFDALDVTDNLAVGGTLQVDGAASVASINTGGLGPCLIGQNLRTTDSPTFAGLTVGAINTGYGDNEVFKISNEGIAFGNVSDSLFTKQIGGMNIGDIKFVYTSGTLIGSSNDYQARLIAPAGGSFVVVYVSPERASSGASYGYTSGGGQIWIANNDNEDSTSLISSAIIRRIS